MTDGFGEAAVARDMPEPCECPSLDRCHKRFLWVRKEVDLAPRPVVGLVLQVGDAMATNSFNRLKSQHDPTRWSELSGDAEIYRLHCAPYHIFSFLFLLTCIDYRILAT